MNLINILNNLESLTSQNEAEKDIFSNVAYICQSSSLICDSLKKGADVAQLENGDIVISERKIFTYKYCWDDKKGKFVRAKDENRFKKFQKSTHDIDEEAFEEA